MKKFLFPALFATLVMFSLAFQANAAAPKISIADPDHNFGVVNEDAQVTSDYTVTNEGDAPLEIERVATS